MLDHCNDGVRIILLRKKSELRELKITREKFENISVVNVVDLRETLESLQEETEYNTKKILLEAASYRNA